MGSSSESRPSSASCSTSAATMFLVMLPMANDMSGLISTSGCETPLAPCHTAPSGKMTAAAAPCTSQRGRPGVERFLEAALHGDVVASAGDEARDRQDAQ